MVIVLVKYAIFLMQKIYNINTYLKCIHLKLRDSALGFSMELEVTMYKFFLFQTELM